MMRILLSLAAILFAFEGVQGQACTFCPDGSEPNFPTDFTGLTCQAAAAGLPPTVGEECDAFHQGLGPLLQLCGCEGTGNATCTLCPTGAEPDLGLAGDSYENCTVFVELLLPFLDESDCDELHQGPFPFLCGCPDVARTNCTLCPDGMPPSGPINEVSFADNCTFIQQVAPLFNESQCLELQLSPLPYVCGCEGVIDMRCTLCPDGSSVGDPSKLLPGDSTTPTCGELEESLPFAFPKDDPQCNYTQEVAAYYCGCPGVERPCFICSDGSAPPNPDIELVPGTTCGDFDLILSVLTSPQECLAAQVTVGTYCGCQNNVSSPDTCRICGDTLLPDPSRFYSLEGYLFGNGTCGFIEYTANTEPGSCGSYQSQYADACCGDACIGICPNGETPGAPNTMVDSFFTCASADAFANSFPAGQDCSDSQSQLAILCECPNVVPTCLLCEDGGDVPNPDFEPVPGEGSCGELALSFGLFEGQTCIAAQATAGVYCGCSNPISDASACRICGGLLPDPGIMAVDPNTSEIDSCGIIEFDANMEGADCQEYQALFADQCCGSVTSPPTTPGAPITLPPTSTPEGTPAPTMVPATSAPITSDTPIPSLDGTTTPPVTIPPSTPSPSSGRRLSVTLVCLFIFTACATLIVQ